MARDLETDIQTLNRVLTFAQNRDFARAAALAENTIASGFEHPMLLNVVATRREQEGRFEDSLRLLERAVAIAPGDIGARNALSMCLQRLDRHQEALEHLETLLKKHPGLSFAHANKGNALISLGLLGRAQESHVRALELEPHSFVSMAALASIATHRGEHAEARRWAERTLAVSPGFPDAVLSLAAADLAEGAIARAEMLLQQLIRDPRAGAADRARATGLLGDVLDAGGRYDEAFRAYTTCNEGLRRIHRDRFAGATTMLEYTRALSEAIRVIAPGHWPTAAAPSAAREGPLEHVFLLGFPRSGTTLLEVILDGHPQVASLEEYELLTDGVRQFMREPLNLEPLSRADESQLNVLRATYWERVRRAGTDVLGKVFIDKNPLNTLKLPLIAKMFPCAKILFARRDPRDVVLSCYRRRFTMNPAMYELLTLQDAAAFYDSVMRFADRVRPLLGLSWRVVRYEDLVGNFSGESSAICEFLNLQKVPGMESFANRVGNRERATPSTAQLARGLVPSAAESWKHYRGSLEPVLPILNPWVEQFGYCA